MFQLLPSPQEMGDWDRKSIEQYGIHQEMLMENASREALAVLRHETGPLRGKKAVLFAGSGNNGGDTFALGRHLHDAGCRVTILHTKPKEKYKGSAGYHLDLAARTGVRLVELPGYDLHAHPGCDIFVDGLLGTGFSGELRREYQDWIGEINKRRGQSFVLSIDIPSGLDGRLGIPRPDAVRAHATVTFEEAKIGLWVGNAKSFTGRIHVRSIGIPRTVKEENPPACFGLTSKVAGLFPRPEDTMHKGTAGHLLVIGGSRGLTGAPVLAGLGALRAGSGMVTVACPGSISREIKAGGYPDIMTLPAGSSDIWSESSLQDVQDHISRFDAVVLGPGLGRQPETEEFVRAFLTLGDLPPLLVDADGLYWIAQQRELLGLLPEGTVLTPHPGEMARLLDTKTTDVVLDRIEAAERLRENRGLIVVHKGAGTIISSPEKTAVSPFTEPALAVGGSGDVLSGCIGSLLARGLSPFHAACLGVFWHGFTGRLLKSRFPLRGNLPQEIAHTFPEAIKELIYDDCQ
ncbi:MAG: NAD(P)H-hydrate dehydratase [Desulfovibrionales bacterium]